MPTSLRHHFAAATGLLLLASVANAQQAPADAPTTVESTPVSSAPRPVWGYLRFAGEFGGDRLVNFQYTDGSNSSVDAGRGVTLVGGLATHLVAHSAGTLDAQLGAGVKYQTMPQTSNQDAYWLRVPVDATLAWRSRSGFGIGGGATAHLLNSFHASGSALDGSFSFKTAVGPVAFVEYGKAAWQIDVRYTSLKYEPSSGGGTLAASNVGVGVTWQFGR